MFRGVIIISCVFFVRLTYGQNYFSVGARSNSLANSSVALSDSWSYFHNPGVLGSLKKTEIGISYENRFLLKELQTQSVVYAQPLKKGVVSLGAMFYGLEIYRSNRIGVGYSLKLLDNLYAGVQMNYQSIQFSSNYTSSKIITAEAGVYLKLIDQWKMGVSLFNLGRSKFSRDSEDRVMTLMRIGSVYEFSELVKWTLEAEKNVNSLLRIKSGVEYNPIKKIFFRVGVATQPMEYTFGFGYRFSHFQLDLGSAFHQQLGWSPHFSFTYKFDSIN